MYQDDSKFSSLNMDLGFKWDNLSWHYFNYCCKGESTSVRQTQVESLIFPTVTWVTQICALVSLTDNCGNNLGWSYQSWSTETTAPGLLSLSLSMNPDFLLLNFRFFLLDFPNMHDAQGGTSYLRYRNRIRTTQSFRV